MHKYLLITVTLLGLTAPLARAQNTLRWQASASVARPAAMDVYRGESLRLAPIYRDLGDTNNWTYTTYWSSNGVIWWSKGLSIDPPTTIHGDPFLWSPDMDCGANAYHVFVRALTPHGVTYRANAILTMINCPGATPNALPLPTPIIDFQTVSVTNAPWATITALQATSNALAEVTQNLSVTDATRIIQTDTNAWLTVEGGTSYLYRVSQAAYPEPSVRVSLVFGTNGYVKLGDYYLVTPDNSPGGVIYSTAKYMYPGSTQNDWSIIRKNEHQQIWALNAERMIPPQAGPTTFTRAVAAGEYGEYTGNAGILRVSPIMTTNRYPIATTADIDGAITTATNTLVQTYILSTNAWLTVSNTSLTVFAPYEGTGTTTAVWSSLESAQPDIDLSFTNALISAIHGKAPRAWGTLAPDGTPNPDPTYQTMLNAPTTVLAGGATWSAAGTYAVLCTAGSAAFAAGASGQLRIGPDISTNYFGYIEGGSVIVGARLGSIHVTDGGTSNGVATIDYDYTGGDYPTLWISTDLATPFTQLDSAFWSDNGNGTATATVPATANRCYYKATTTATVGSTFFSSMPAHLGGGIFGATNAPPVRYDSTITITSGGKTYRIPAELVP